MSYSQNIPDSFRSFSEDWGCFKGWTNGAFFPVKWSTWPNRKQSFLKLLPLAGKITKEMDVNHEEKHHGICQWWNNRDVLIITWRWMLLIPGTGNEHGKQENEKWEQNEELEMKLLHDGIGSKVGFVPIFHFCLFPFSVLVTRYPLQ